jgi:hypothetical protein
VRYGVLYEHQYWDTCPEEQYGSIIQNTVASRLILSGVNRKPLDVRMSPNQICPGGGNTHTLPYRTLGGKQFKDGQVHPTTVCFAPTS